MARRIYHREPVEAPDSKATTCARCGRDRSEVCPLYKAEADDPDVYCHWCASMMLNGE